MTTSPFEAADGGVFVRVRLTPKASRDAVLGVVDSGDGGAALKAAVTAVPEKGKANEALIKLLSKQWRVAKSDIEIRSGAADRNKRLFVIDDGSLAPRLEAWLSRLK